MLLAGAAALIVPAIDDSQGAQPRPPTPARPPSGARRAAAGTIAEQRPRTLDAAALRPASGAPDAERLAARAALLQRAETAISDDARARAEAGELEGRPQGTECEPYPKRSDRADWPDRDLGAARGVYDCLVFVRAIASTETNVGGQLGYPFRAVLDFERFSVDVVQDQPGARRARRARPAHGARAARRPAAPPRPASRRTGHRGERPSSDGFP